MFKAQILLTIMSLFVGYFFNDLMIGLGTPVWNNSILILPYHDSLLKFCFLPFYIKDLPLIFCFLGIFYYSMIFYLDKMYDLKNFNMLNNLFNLLSNLINNKYYLLISNVGYMLFILTNYIIIYLYELIIYFI